MHKTSHLRVAGVIKKAVEKELGIKLNTYSFMYGNIKPDLSYHLIRIGHFKHKSFDFIRQQIDNLMNYKIEINSLCSREFSRKLGIITHFLTDFFCHAHKKDFNGSFVSHYLYELRLGSYLKHKSNAVRAHTNYSSSSESSEHQSVYDFIEEMHRQYDSSNPSFILDITYILKVCISVVSHILRSCTVRKIEAAA